MNSLIVQKNQIDGVVSTLKGVNKNTNDFLVFNNCVSKLTIGEREVPIGFDKMLYSAENNLLFIFLKDSLCSFEDLKTLLDKLNISYRQYNFDNTSSKANSNLKEIYLTGEKNDLRNILMESKKNGLNSCTYYPNVTGNLEMGYMEDGKVLPLKKIEIREVVSLEDKIILIMDGNIKDDKLFKITMELPIKTLVDTSYDISDFELEHNDYLYKKVWKVVRRDV